MTTDLSTTTPQCWRDFEFAVQAGLDRITLYGLPGIGKTYSAMTYGLGGRPAYRLTCTEDMTTFDIVGGYLPNKAGGMEWHEGIALRAWREGARLVIDEADRASGDAMSLLLSICDSKESAVLIHPDTAETLRPAEGFTAIITSNIASTHELHTALNDRFVVAIEINEAHPTALEALPDDLRAIAAKVVALTDERRSSLRAFEAYAKARNSISEAIAMRLIFGDKAEALAEAIKFGSL